LRQNDHVERDRLVFGVVEIVFQFEERIFHHRQSFDLRPAGDAGANRMADGEIRNPSGEGFAEELRFGARPHQRHAAADHPEKL